MARSAASRARPSLAVPVPIMAAPISDITVLTSAKSTFTRPGRMTVSDTLYRAKQDVVGFLEGVSKEVFDPSTSSSFSLGIVIKESQCWAISTDPHLRCCRFFPSKLKGESRQRRSGCPVLSHLCHNRGNTRASATAHPR